MSHRAVSDGCDLDDREVRSRLSAPAFRAFVDTADYLDLPKRDALWLLGHVSEATFDLYVAEGPPCLNPATMQRMSHVFGIVKALRTIFAEDEAGLRWLRDANHDAPFDGMAPLERMLHGDVLRLGDVRAYLDQWQKGLP